MSNAKTSSQNLSRRRFLGLSGTSLIAGGFAFRFLTHGEAAFGQGNPPLVKEDEPQAKALGYYADAKKVDTKKWPKRAGAEGAKQYCYNCQFYQTKGDPKASKEAP